MKNKIFRLKQLSKIISKLKNKKKKISLCHGVFDLLHPGHIQHFEQAKKNSDILIVSITTDKKVNKGPGRPYFNETTRMKSLAALEIVDYVILSNDKSSINIIKKIKPDLYVKGSDYKKFKNDLTGKIKLEVGEIKKYGGKILFTGGETFSSSSFLNRDFIYNEEQNKFLENLKKKYNLDQILDFINKLKNYTPFVLGESIIDEYVFCQAIGKSGKESYMVFQEQKSENYCGGVLSIAQNISALSQKVNLLTQLGNEKKYVNKIKKELRNNVNLNYINQNKISTIVKKRFIEETDNTKVMGVYNIDKNKYSIKEENILLKTIKKFVSQSDLMILSDYGHGFFNNAIRKKICNHKIFLALNVQLNSFSMGNNTIKNYKKADFLLMNENEARIELNDKISSRKQIIKKIIKLVKVKYIAITHGKDGASIYSNKEKKIVHVPAFAKKIVDKVGAGDALFPVLALCLKSKVPVDISLYIASISAAINVENNASKIILDQNYFKKYIDHSLK